MLSWLVFISVLLVFSCGKETAGNQESAPVEEASVKTSGPVAVTETEELDPVEAPELDQGLITFFSGNVYILDGQEWWDVNIGDFVEASDVIKTELDSYCEIQFGDTAVVKVQQNTEIAMETLMLDGENANVALNMQNGSVLCKVQKLAGGDKFKVKTQTAVCGVRGTEFGVQAETDKKTKVAVKEGSVSVLPSTIDVDKLKEKVANKGEDVQNLLAQIEETASVVEANQELELEEADVAQTEKSTKEIEKVVEEIALAEEPEVTPEKLVKLAKTIQEQKTEIIESVTPAKDISEESRKELEAIDKMELIRIPVAQKDEKPSEDKDEPEKILPQLIKVSLVVEPEDALISINGENVGRGKFSRIYPEGEDLSFAITREGYAPHSMSFVTSQETGKLYRIKLAEIPEPEPVMQTVNIEATPKDAEIYLDGTQVGKGSLSREFETGQSLTFTARRDGYEDKTIEVAVREGGKTNFTIDLAKQTEEIVIQTFPSDAEIYLEGKQVGTGNYNDQFEIGKKLAFKVQKEGYEPQTVEVDVKEGGGRAFDVSLTKIEKEEPEAAPKEEEIVIRSSPADADIYLDGRRVGSGSYADTFDLGERISISVRKSGYQNEQLSISVTEGSGGIYSVNLRPKTEQITVQTSPRNADIYLNGRRVGSGTFTDTFRLGEQLSFRVRETGYEEETISLSVREGMENSYNVNLQPLTEEIIIRTDPRSAVIYLNGSQVATGYFADEFRVGETLSFTVRKEGYNENSLNVSVQEGSSRTYTVSLEKSIITEDVTLRTTPSNAVIYLDGRRVGTGRYSDEHEAGERLSFRIEQEGYETQTRDVTVRSGMEAIAVRLERKTIERTIQFSGGQIVGSLIADGDTIYGANNYGVLSAVSLSGDKIWSINTKNSPNENSYPVIIDGNIYFSGSREFIIVNGADGSILNREALSGSTAHLFGRRVVEYGSRVLFPTNDTINIIDKNSGRLLEQVNVPKGSRMTPGTWDGSIVIADQQGALLLLDPDSNSPVEATISTSAVQPVALGITVIKDRAFFSGRKGTVVCADLNMKRTLWEKKISENASVFTDVQAGPAGAYVYSKGTIYGLSMINGSELFSPVTGATCPPLYHDNKIYYGTPNQLVIRNAASGSVERVIDLGSKVRISARPVMTNSGKLLLGTEDGTVFVINP